MKKIATSLVDLVGNTPLIELKRFQAAKGSHCHIIAKLEYYNPAGSVKDRIAKAMIESAEQQGFLKSGGVVIEPTSGNTGIGLAAVAAAKGYRLILTMPETMSLERRQLLTALGAELHLTEGSRGMKGAIERASALHAEIEGSILLNQFENGANPQAHYRTTSEEIWRDTNGEIDIFVAGVGTGGTISGVGRRLKELNPNIKIVAVEAASSPVLSGGAPGAHKIQGISAGFIPKNFDPSVVDSIIQVENEEAFAAARNLATIEGILVGISCGAALHAATLLASDSANAGKRIVVILPDGGERYLSTGVYNQAPII